MKRRFFTIASAASLAMLLAVLVLWAASYRFPPNRAGGDGINFTRTDPRWWVLSNRGRITLCRQEGRDWGSEFPGFDYAGFKYGGLRGPKGSLYNLAIPHWFAAALLLPLPLMWVSRCRSARAGCCIRCGYDLRATPDRCSECGTPAAGHQRAL